MEIEQWRVERDEYWPDTTAHPSCATNFTRETWRRRRRRRRRESERYFLLYTCFSKEVVIHDIKRTILLFTTSSL